MTEPKLTFTPRAWRGVRDAGIRNVKINTRSIRFRPDGLVCIKILSAALCIFSGLIWAMMEQRLMGDILAGAWTMEASRFETFVQREVARSRPSI